MYNWVWFSVTYWTDETEAATPWISGVFKGGGGLCEPPTPLGRTAVIFVTIVGLFLSPFRDKIAATGDQMHFLGRKML